MKKSIILLELIFVIVLLSIIFLTTTKVLFAIHDKNRSNFATTLTKIEFESTRLFLINILQQDSNLDKISYDNEKLFYDLILLQENVTSFNQVQNNDIYTIDICIKLDTNICQTWIIK